MSVYDWDAATPANNGTADADIVASENQSASTLNNAIRGVMMQISKLVKDHNGAITTAGTSTAYTATSNHTFGSFSGGEQIVLTIDETCGDDPTLNVDSVGAVDILRSHNATDNIKANDLVINRTYRFVYNATAGAWVVQNFQAAEFLAATSMLFYQATAPTGWTAEAINDKALRVVSSGSTGGADGGTTAFSSVLASRTLTAGNIPSHTHTFSATTSTTGAHTHTYTKPVSNNNHTFGANTNQNSTTTANTSSAGDHSHTVSGTTAATGSGDAIDFAIQYSDVIIATKD